MTKAVWRHFSISNPLWPRRFEMPSAEGIERTSIALSAVEVYPLPIARNPPLMRRQQGRVGSSG
jgi:hypothetical protein